MPATQKKFSPLILPETRRLAAVDVTEKPAYLLVEVELRALISAN
jgi:hypothetical protein